MLSLRPPALVAAPKATGKPKAKAKQNQAEAMVEEVAPVAAEVPKAPEVPVAAVAKPKRKVRALEGLNEIELANLYKDRPYGCVKCKGKHGCTPSCRTYNTIPKTS